jgi:hypothetical protein
MSKTAVAVRRGRLFDWSQAGKAPTTGAGGRTSQLGALVCGRTLQAAVSDENACWQMLDRLPPQLRTVYAP